MFNTQIDWFVRYNYWAKWARCLQRMGGDFKYAIDIDIEPGNDFPGDIDHLKQINLRKHTTYETPKNFKHDFPNYVYNDLVNCVGHEYAQFIIDYPILESLKPGALDRMDSWNQAGGGVPFILITKEPFKFKFLLDDWERQLKLNSEAGRRARRLQYYSMISKVMDPTVDTVLVGAGSGLEPGVYYTYSLGCLGLSARIDGGVFDVGPFTHALKLREQKLKDLILFKHDIERDTVDVVTYTLKF